MRRGGGLARAAFLHVLHSSSGTPGVKAVGALTGRQGCRGDLASPMPFDPAMDVLGRAVQDREVGDGANARHVLDDGLEAAARLLFGLAQPDRPSVTGDAYLQ
eukprot:74070-Chlamydomonas_euryale.AAC.1